jgi:hypothetical protein
MACDSKAWEKGEKIDKQLGPLLTPESHIQDCAIHSMKNWNIDIELYVEVERDCGAGKRVNSAATRRDFRAQFSFWQRPFEENTMIMIAINRADN